MVIPQNDEDDTTLPRLFTRVLQRTQFKSQTNMHNIPRRLHDVLRLFWCKRSIMSKNKYFFTGVNKNVVMTQNQSLMLRQRALRKARIQMNGSIFSSIR